MADDTSPTAEAKPAGAQTGSADSGLVPQDKVNRLEAKWRREAEAAAAKAAELEAKLAQFAEGQKTESEKLAERARKEAAAERDKYWSSEIRRVKLEASALSAGVHPDLIDSALKILGDTPDEEVMVELKRILEEKPHLRGTVSAAEFVRGQTGSPTGTTRNTGWNQDRLNRMLSMGQASKITEEDWAEIKEAHARGVWR